MRRRGVASLAIALLLLAPPADAGGERPAEVVVRLDPCLPALTRDELLAAVGVELRETTDVVSIRAGADDVATTAVVAGPGCDATRLLVRVWVDRSAIVPSAERSLDLAGVVDAQRARVVAIAVAELLRAALDDPAQDAPLGAERPLPPPRSAQTPSTPRGAPRLRDLRVLLGLAARGAVDPPSLHVGPRLDVRLAVTSWLDATAGGSALFAGEHTALGDVSTRSLLARGGLAVATRGARHQLDAGVLAEVGGTTITADAASDAVVARGARGVAAAIALAAGGELAPAAPFRVRLDVEVGHAVAAVEGLAGGQPVPGYGGPFAGAALLVGAAF